MWASHTGLFRGKMTEHEVWDYLGEIAKSGSILGLENMRNLMNELANVQDNLRFIHVAGTNGKGSVCAMVSSILQQAGIRVGRYTSPVVFDRMEQYQVNGEPISIDEFVTVISEVRAACERMIARGMAQPTVFEVETAAAFLYFYRQNCEVVVLETGMGGETDATNVITAACVCVLTSISMDHMKFLGSDLTQIARIKAGIIKEGSYVVAIKPRQEEIQGVLEDVCRDKHAVLVYSDFGKADQVRYFADANNMQQVFHYPLGDFGETLFPETEDYLPENADEIVLSLLGDYQIENAVCAIETAKVLQKIGFHISKDNVRKGLLRASWEGRFSVLCKHPLFVMDGAHNANAAQKLYETIKRGFTNYKIIYIIGVLADKEHEEMLKMMLPLACQVYTVTPDHPRAMNGQALASEAGKYHGQVMDCRTVEEAVNRALSGADDSTMILAFGSLSYLRELRETVKEKIKDDR